MKTANETDPCETGGGGVQSQVTDGSRSVSHTDSQMCLDGSCATKVTSAFRSVAAASGGRGSETRGGVW